MRNNLFIRSVLFVLATSSAAFASTPGDDYVVGGTATPVGKYPDAVAVIAPMALCTGTLIAPDVVLTAGHCIDTHPAEVVLNNVDLSKQGGDVIAVKSAVAYPNWQHEYDVGVLVLEHAATEKPRAIAAACTVKHLTDGADVRVVGFGLTDKAGTGENLRLHDAALVVDDATCAKDPACAPAVAPGGEFTAGGGGTDACFGDSGGPIYLDNALVGVVSRGVGTAGSPCGNGGVYVRADKVVSWIEKETGRKVTRATCDGKGDGADGDPAAAAGGGCSVGGGALGGGALLVLAALWLMTLRRERA